LILSHIESRGVTIAEIALGCPSGSAVLLTLRHAGKGHTKYVQPVNVPELSREIENYRRFREFTTKWLELEIELAKPERDEGKSTRRATGKA